MLICITGYRDALTLPGRGQRSEQTRRLRISLPKQAVPHHAQCHG